MSGPRGPSAGASTALPTLSAFGGTYASLTSTPDTLACAVTLGCGDQQSPTTPTDVTKPSLSAERVPVLQPQFLGGDPSNPLAVQASYEAGLIADDICPDTGAHVDPNAAGQGISYPARGFVFHVNARDVSVVVYEFGGGIVTNICQLVGATVLVTGTANYSSEGAITGQGAIVFHVTLQGVIDLVSGGRLASTRRCE